MHAKRLLYSACLKKMLSLWSRFGTIYFSARSLAWLAGFSYCIFDVNSIESATDKQADKQVDRSRVRQTALRGPLWFLHLTLCLPRHRFRDKVYGKHASDNVQQAWEWPTTVKATLRFGPSTSCQSSLCSIKPLDHVTGQCRDGNSRRRSLNR